RRSLEPSSAPPARAPARRARAYLRPRSAYSIRPWGGPETVTETSYEQQPAARPSDTIAGFLSALAIFAALVRLAWHPLPLIPAAMLIALIAAGMSGRNQRLGFAAVIIAMLSFFAGMAIAVIAETPLW